CSDTRSSSGSHLASTVDDLTWNPATRQAPGVGPVEVVGPQVLLEVSCQRCALRRQGPGERRTPALLEDRQLQALDVPVRGWAPSSDATVLHAQARKL